jgi:hypothetical protein
MINTFPPHQLVDQGVTKQKNEQLEMENQSLKAKLKTRTNDLDQLEKIRQAFWVTLPVYLGSFLGYQFGRNVEIEFSIERVTFFGLLIYGLMYWLLDKVWDLI